MASKQRNHLNATYTTLRLVRAGRYPAQISAALREAKSTTSRRLRRWEGKLVKRENRSSTIFYSITPAGLEALKVLGKGVRDATLTSTFRWHHLMFKVPVQLKGPLEAEVLRERHFVRTNRGFLRGWESLLRYGRAFFVGSAFLIFLSPIEDRSLSAAMVRALSRVDWMIERLERMFPQARFPVRTELCREQLAKVGGPTRWIPEGFFFKGDRVLIDCSTGEAEIETWGKYSMDAMVRLAEVFDAIACGDVTVDGLRAACVQGAASEKPEELYR